MEAGKEQYIYQLSMLEQEAQKLQEQMQIIEQQVLELQSLEHGLQELDKTNEKAMLSNLGKGIFMKTEIKDKNLFVDVGNKTFVKKDVPQTLKIIEEQLSKLIEAKNQIMLRMQELQEQMQTLFAEVQNTEKEK